MSDSVGRLPGVDGPCTVGGPVGLGRGFGIAVTPGLPLPIEGGVVGVGLGRDCPRTRPRISANDGRSGAVGGRLMVGGAVGGRLMVGGAVGGRLMVGGVVGAVGVGREFAVGDTPGLPLPIDGGVGLGRDCPKSRWRTSASEGRLPEMGGAERFDDEKEGGRIVGAGAGVDGLGTA